MPIIILMRNPKTQNLLNLAILTISILTIVLTIGYFDPLHTVSRDISPNNYSTSSGYWNGYLGQINVLECLNLSSSSSTAEVIIKRDNAEIISKIPISLAPYATQHLILNELKDSKGNGITDSY